ncbi:amidohydrolase [Paractinoplanes lichenicola]|uniref:Amidohydrolase n=1 Tax=Paractinoplanes lichenicola TaxID=2802976 RepID=A0ABS1W2V9_9ACTN|nr:amidohydrolase [Actinoplanes lichenicola]MBL7261071.1 amidohydrolase [Actinoplanes lichenicola]
MLIDCHQHLWPARLVEALRRRQAFPFMRGWTLHLPGENPYEVDPLAHDVEHRRTSERADRVLVSLSSPLGIEHLPAHDGAELIGIWHESALELGGPFHVWAAAGVTEPDPDGLAKVLREERVAGLQLPATALADPQGIEHVGPLLDEARKANKPVLVHPGPAPACDPGLPAWWPALVPYVSQMHQAWLAWHVAGLPDVRIGFVALAGLAPLHHERLTARGGRLGALNANVFYETSSYGTRAIDALVRVVGVDPIVSGSDRPYAEATDPNLGAAFTHALFTANPHHFLTGEAR